MSRTKNRFKPKPVVFIACEGTSSEFNYFTSWAQTDRVLELFERVDVYPSEKDKNPKTTPYELLEIAKEVLDNRSADIIWIVFDKDVHPKLEETFKESDALGIKIAFSSRSIEEWVLLHFEKNSFAFQTTECKIKIPKKKNKVPINCGTSTSLNCLPNNCCLCGHIRRQQFIPDYSKKGCFDLFSTISKKTELAIVNATWLRYKLNSSINRTQYNRHQLNPYSDVDQLILLLNGKDDKIEWGQAGTDVSLSNWILNVRETNGVIIVKFSHMNPQAEVLNDNFPLPLFFTTDDALIDNKCIPISFKYIENSNGSTISLLYKDDIIEYCFRTNNQPYFLFRDTHSSSRIYIEL